LICISNPYFITFSNSYPQAFKLNFLIQTSWFFSWCLYHLFCFDLSLMFNCISYLLWSLLLHNLVYGTNTNLLYATLCSCSSQLRIPKENYISNHITLIDFTAFIHTSIEHIPCRSHASSLYFILEILSPSSPHSSYFSVLLLCVWSYTLSNYSHPLKPLLLQILVQ